jgi:hypothetical protein
MIKGMFVYDIARPLSLTKNSVMSGIITGPYFIKFFGTPNAIEVGTMVAVLEIGAFSEVLHLLYHAQGS